MILLDSSLPSFSTHYFERERESQNQTKQMRKGPPHTHTHTELNTTNGVV